MSKSRKIFVLFTLICLCSVGVSDSALAKPKPHQRHRNHSNHQALVNIEFNTIQKERLINLLQSRDRYSYLVSPTIRLEIRNQINSLPPGIQKRLAKGKGLPPGIAKRIILPRTINDRLDLSRDIDIVVLGGNVVILDPLTGVVVDLLRDIF
ncbi:MAG: hypothetical protein ACFCU5_05945 [Pleurocapsa sp.]